MSKTMSRKQREMQQAAAERREVKQIAHKAMLARHAERRAAIDAYKAAFAAWEAAGFGPKPVHPDEVGGHVLHPAAGTGELIADIGGPR